MKQGDGPRRATRRMRFVFSCLMVACIALLLLGPLKPVTALAEAQRKSLQKEIPRPDVIPDEPIRARRNPASAAPAKKPAATKRRGPAPARKSGSP